MQRTWQRLTQERKEVLVRLKDAREMGDLSENGAYKYAKFELGSLNRQLKELRYLLENGEIFVKPASTGVVTFGSTVVLKTNGKKITYTLVNQHESDPSQGKLSLESPLGSLLLGKKVGETVSLVLPKGKTEYLVEKIS